MKLTKTASPTYTFKKNLFLIFSILMILASVGIWSFYIFLSYCIEAIPLVDTLFSKNFFFLIVVGTIFISLLTSRYSNYKLLATTTITPINLTTQKIQIKNETFEAQNLTGIYLNYYKEMNMVSIVTAKKKIDIPYDADLLANQTCLESIKKWAETQNVRFENNYVMHS